MEYQCCSIPRLGVQVSHIWSLPDFAYSASGVELPLPASAHGQRRNRKNFFGTTVGIGLLCTAEQAKPCGFGLFTQWLAEELESRSCSVWERCIPVRSLLFLLLVSWRVGKVVLSWEAIAVGWSHLLTKALLGVDMSRVLPMLVLEGTAATTLPFTQFFGAELLESWVLKVDFPQLLLSFLFSSVCR